MRTIPYRRLAAAALAGTLLASPGAWAQSSVPSPVTAAPLPEIGAEPPVGTQAVESPALAPQVTESPIGPSASGAPLTARPVDLPGAIRAAVLASETETSVFGAKRRAAAAAEFYAERADQPVWIVGGSYTPAARAVVARISRADEDGLDPSAFALPDVADDVSGLSHEELAAREVGLSLAILAFVDQASTGRVTPGRIAKDITRKPTPLDPIAALSEVAAAADPAVVLDGFNPPHDAFRRLREMLADVRSRPPVEKPEPIAAGPTLKPGMTDPRVPLIRARLDLPEAVDPLAADVYDGEVEAAMKAFQAKSGLVADGIVGSRTLAVLNGEDRDEEGEILANMEMWRWMPRDLGQNHVLVNVPEFMVRVVRDGVQIHEARVVVGKPANQTPIFSDEMEYLVVNPYWHVPESIKVKEMLPEIQADPGSYFARHGYEVVWDGQVIDPNSVIWDENAVKAVGIRQVPGEANALGNIKFMFPNQHAVYLHDTPSRKLFQRDYRAYSHGCVRVDDPLAFAAAVLRGEPEWTVDKLEAMFGGSERRVDLSQRLRVHIAYFTAWVDDAGRLQMRDDLYGHVKKVKSALGLTS